MPVRKRVWAKTPFWVKSLYAAAAVVWTAVLALAAWQKQSVEPEILEQDMPHRMSEFAAEVPVQDGPEFVLESAADTPAYIDCAPLEPTAQECAAICAAYETSPARKIVFGENGRVDYTDAAVGVTAARPMPNGRWNWRKRFCAWRPAAGKRVYPHAFLCTR